MVQTQPLARGMTPHPGQLMAMTGRRRYYVVACGRRWGKTEMGMALLIQTVMLRNEPVAWFAPTYKLLGDVWRRLAFDLAPWTVASNKTDRRIELQSGGVVEMWTLEDEDAGRGRLYSRVVIDEAAMVPQLLTIWAAAIRPTLTDLAGDAWFFSTPKGRNDFWQMYQQGLDPLQSDWQCWQMPTRTNPLISSAEIEAARHDLPERVFQQEYLAEFLEDSAVFRGIREAATARPQRWSMDELDTSHGPRHEYIVGVDWGKYEDYSVFAVIDATTSELCHLDRSNHIEYQLQLERLKQLVSSFSARQVVAESNSIGDPLAEQLRRAGVPLQEFTTTNRSKQELIEALMLALEQGKIKILNDPVLIAELQAFEATRLPGGGLRYAAPDGYHDDCVMALALAWSDARRRVDRKPLQVQRTRTVR